MEAGDRDIRYQPDEKPPPLIAAGLGFQAAVLMVGGIVLTPVIIARAAGAASSYVTWAIFGVLLISGLTTILQAMRLGRLGSGHVLMMGTSGAFISVSVAALEGGGPGLLATLVLFSSLFQFLLVYRMAAVRRILTPPVAGAVIMLIAVTVMPILFDMMDNAAPDAPPAAAPVGFGVTLVIAVAMALRAPGILRLWGPILGVAVGAGAGAFFGLGDYGAVAEAAWFGLPAFDWPGLDISFGPAFWALLPAFVLVTLVGAVETIGDAVAIQQVSWRSKRAPDYRLVQGALGADGVGNFLSGLIGVPPNTTYSTSISLVELTGVASRLVGVHVGIVFLVLAFMPKATALVVSIPDPVIAAYTFVLIAVLFMVGFRIAARDGMDLRTATVIGVAYWVGVGFQSRAIFPGRFGEFWESLLGNGMTAGGGVILLLMLFLVATGPRAVRFEAALDRRAMPRLDEFLVRWAERRKWSDRSRERLRSSGEEAFLLIAPEDGTADRKTADRKLRVTARGDARSVEVEFVAAPSETNFEDQLLTLGDSGVAAEQEISLRLLRHHAASVRHQQYNEVDVVTVVVEARA